MPARIRDLVSRRYADGICIHGQLGVEPDKFEEQLRAIAERHLGSSAAVVEIEEFIAGLHTSDLMLSVACAKGYESAWRRFCDLYRKYLVSLTRRRLGRRSDPKDLGETLWVDLFLPDNSGNSRIASYDGRSSLATWLRAVVNNRVINELQRKSSLSTTVGVTREPADPPALRSLEARLSRQRYEEIIRRSFSYASSRLTSHDRGLLLLRFDEGYQLGDISRIYSVHQSTITRQLDRIVSRLRTDAISVMTCEYRMGAAAVEECMNAACDAFSNSLSILSLLEATGGK